MDNIVIVEDAGVFIVPVGKMLALLICGKNIAEQRMVDGIDRGELDSLKERRSSVGRVVAKHVENAETHVVVIVVGREHGRLLHLTHRIVEPRAH